MNIKNLQEQSKNIMCKRENLINELQIGEQSGISSKTIDGIWEDVISRSKLRHSGES